MNNVLTRIFLAYKRKLFLRHLYYSSKHAACVQKVISMKLSISNLCEQSKNCYLQKDLFSHRDN